MELNIKFDEKLIVEAANRVLDEFDYNGKTIREWADSLTHPHQPPQHPYRYIPRTGYR